MRRYEGFTLIEVLIALFIFAILSTITVVELRSVIDSYHDVIKRQQKLQRLSLTATLLRRDISQIVYRPSMDTTGRRLLPLRSVSDGFIFVRTGAENPFDLFRNSDLLSVSYLVEKGQLVRIAYSADVGSYGHLLALTLLNNISGMTVNYVEQSGTIISQWPPPNPNQPGSAQQLPTAIKVTITLRPGDEITFVLPIEAGRQYAKG